MVNDLKVGDRVWVIDHCRAWEVEIAGVGFSETQVNVRHGYSYHNEYMDECFPSLDSLLNYLRDTAIYYREK